MYVSKWSPFKSVFLQCGIASYQVRLQLQYHSGARRMRPRTVRRYVQANKFVYTHSHTCVHAVHIHTHIYPHTYISIPPYYVQRYMQTNIFIYTHTHTCIHTVHIHTHIYPHTYMSIPPYSCAYTYMFIHIYMHFHIHTYTHKYWVGQKVCLVLSQNKTFFIFLEEIYWTLYSITEQTFLPNAIYSYLPTCIFIYPHVHTHKHAHVYSHKHVRTCMHVHPHMHVNAHTFPYTGI